MDCKSYQRNRHRLRFILPGISGGVLAAILGIYERMIGFLVHPFKDFKENVLYFIPVAIGCC